MIEFFKGQTFKLVLSLLMIENRMSETVLLIEDAFINGKVA